MKFNPWLHKNKNRAFIPWWLKGEINLYVAFYLQVTPSMIWYHTFSMITVSTLVLFNHKRPTCLANSLLLTFYCSFRQVLSCDWSCLSRFQCCITKRCENNISEYLQAFLDWFLLFQAFWKQISCCSNPISNISICIYRILRLNLISHFQCIYRILQPKQKKQVN